MAKHAASTLTEEQLAPEFQTFYGVPVTLIYDEQYDAEHFIALGHHEPKRFLAAMLAYTRKQDTLDPDDYLLDDFDTANTGVARWHAFYDHGDRIAVDEPDRDEDWCVCDDHAWLSVQHTGPGDSIIPTMVWRVD